MPPSEPDIRHDRQHYERGRLDEADLGQDPVATFQQWLQTARDEGVDEAHAMTLATVGEGGRPSARIVLLRGVDERGFLFFTSYEGRKARELQANPEASLVFFWQPLERQVRVEGHVVRASPEESDDYFAGRPRASQLGAWASPQSRELASREQLEQRLVDVTARFEGQETIPRPPDWGGLRLLPRRIEFWQGRRSRLHDRLAFTRDGDGAGWTRSRLAP